MPNKKEDPLANIADKYGTILLNKTRSLKYPQPNYDKIAQDIDYEEVEEREEVDKETLKATKQQEQLTQEEIRLAKEKERQVEDARRQAHQANALPATVPVGAPSSALPTANSQEKALEKQQEITEEKQEIESDVAQDIEEAKENTDKKIRNIEDGPHFPFSFFSGPFLFFATAALDSLLSHGFIGDLGMFIFLAILWFIPCMIIMDIGAYVPIFMLLLVDFIFGTGTSSLEFILPGAGTGIDMILDAVPEAIALAMGFAPYQVLQRAWEGRKADLISHQRELLKLKIARIRARGKERLHHFIAGIRGRFSGAGTGGRKLIVFALIIIISYLTQFQGFFGTESNAQIFNVGILVILLIAFVMSGILSQREFAGVLAVLGINIFYKYIIRTDSILASFLPDWLSPVVIIGLFILLAGLLILHILAPDALSTRGVFAWFIFIIFGLSLLFYVPYLNSPRFQEDLQLQQAQTQAELDTFNFWERAFNWYYEMQARGEGTYIAPADQEQVHEYIGITMSEVQASRAEFIEGQPVQVNIQYTTGSKSPINVLTSCDTLGKQANVTPVGQVPATELYTPVVRCVFAGLPKGVHTIQVNAFYNYNSRIEIPLYIMTQTQQTAILERGGDPESFIGSIDKPRTSSGPVDFGVSNSLGDNPTLKLPLVYSREEPNELPQTIFLSLKNPEGNKRTQGDLKVINNIQFDLPEGLNIGNCDFMPPGTGIIEPTSRDNGRWVVDVTEHFETFKLNDVISCDLFINEDYTSTFLPATGYSLSTMYFSIDYTYGLSQLAPVTVS